MSDVQADTDRQLAGTAALRLRSGRWWVDLGEMLVAMFAGMAVGHMVQMSVGEPGPTAALLLMGVYMAVGMTVWMLWRRASLTHRVEMNLTMLVPFGLAAVGYEADVFSEDTAMSLGHVVMLVAMVVLHLFRPCRAD